MKNKLLHGLLLVCLTALIFQACKKDRTVVYVTPTVNNPTNPLVNYSVGILSAFKKAAPAMQTFTGDATTGFWITGAQGCKFYFPANALLDASNMAVSGNVTIELTEYMNKADMLFAGVTVGSGNQLLESGGMFYLMAKKNGAELHLKNNVGFFIQIPQTNNTPDPMDFWNGAPNTGDSLNKIDWVKKDTVKIIPKKDSGQFKSYYGLQFDYFKFGYCNIDREWSKFKTFISKFRVKLPKGCNDTNSTALLLFKNYNCCAWCNWLNTEDAISTHYQLPLGETIKVLVYKKTGKGEDDLEYAIKEVVLSDDTEVDFIGLVKCTNLELEGFIKAL